MEIKLNKSNDEVYFLTAVKTNKNSFYIHTYNENGDPLTHKSYTGYSEYNTYNYKGKRSTYRNSNDYVVLYDTD